MPRGSFIPDRLRDCVVHLTRMAAALVGLAILGLLSARVLQPPPETQSGHLANETADGVRALREHPLDPQGGQPIQREVDYREGAKAAWYPKNEAPVLRELVQAGKLPPVAERVGPEPVVMAGIAGIGRYGGTWYRAANSVSDIAQFRTFLTDVGLVRWSPHGHPIVPLAAKSWTVSADRRVWTFTLRQGMKWSDGHPFTAGDIVYWWKYDAVITTGIPRWMKINGRPGDIVQLDDLTVQFRFPEPYVLLPEVLASLQFESYAAPRHYLEKFHPTLGDPAVIERAMRQRSSVSREALYRALSERLNPEYPRLWPWVLRTYSATPPFIFVRNPYYWGVDPEGNQLPYVDRIQFDVINPKLIPVAAASGRLTMQERHLSFTDYTLLMENRAAGGYDVYHWYPADRSVWTIWPNQNRRADPGDKVANAKAALLQDRRFRQALSLAIDRRTIIAAEYSGVGEPAQLSPGPESPLHHDGLLRSFTAFDPAAANRLLDELGLDRRDHEGFRTFPDGSRMTWYLEFSDFTGPGPVYFVVDDWRAIGLRTIPHERSRPLFTSEQNARLHDFTVHVGGMEFEPMLEPRSFVPVYQNTRFASAYGLWYRDGGLNGDPKATRNGGIEPPLGHPLRQAMEWLRETSQTIDPKARREKFDRILDLAAKEVWTISIATPPPVLAVVKNGFRGVPRSLVHGFSYNPPANGSPETFYFESPEALGAVQQEQFASEMLAPRGRESWSARAGATHSDSLGRLVRALVVSCAVAALLLVAFRHPYIARRLLVLAPTLAVMAVITFIVIRLPPGDFIETRTMELEASGIEGAAQEMRQLREQFQLDASPATQFAQWVGLKWFVTWKDSDRGVLQGNLGYSMEYRQPVNELLGDRIILTLIISVGTVLFTWMVALPIGIYSAVRQYSVGDYLFTFLGFLGMCVPSFLVALVLVNLGSRYLGLDAGSLMSVEFSSQQGWSVGRLLNLLGSLWLPVVVLGIAGAGHMIRVMRGNLLDELRKPYVVTARAKGMRPFRLIIKYPLRIALNPFVSGLGTLFPQLISGGAIVSIVLSLPTVGPLMLSALMSEDMFLAGSLLMVLSLLGVFGTLVSDLILLWLDPRIRLDNR